MIDPDTLEKFCKAFWNATVGLTDWDGESEEQRASVRKWSAAAFQALEAEGYRLCPPGHMLIPQSDQEAKIMNAVSEKFLERRGPFIDANKPRGDSAIRYVITYVNKDGMRKLVGAAQGRNTFATPSEAQACLDAITGNTSASTIAQIFGSDPRFEVRPCPCYPGHFDPQSVWFDN